MSAHLSPPEPAPEPLPLPDQRERDLRAHDLEQILALDLSHAAARALALDGV